MKYELKEKIEHILDRYKSGEIGLVDIYDESDDLSEELFPGDYPEYDKNDPRSVHVDILSFLEMFNWIFPEDVDFARTCLKESLSDPIGTQKKWDEYWDSQKMDEDHRYKEGVEKGYWEDVFERFK